MQMTRALDEQAEGTEADDAALVARWRAGDEAAATALVRRHAPALARFAQSLGVRQEVEELVQDTFVRAFQALDGFRGESALLTWLFTIARRLVLDRRRTEVRRRAHEVDEPVDAPVEHTALDGLVADETHRRVQGRSPVSPPCSARCSRCGLPRGDRIARSRRWPGPRRARRACTTTTPCER
jgi:RNA polymerase sigma factor (sigma-70 family)